MGRDAKAVEIAGGCHPLPKAGEYFFLYKDSVKVGIIHGCPCGCGSASTLFFKGLGDGRPEWTIEKPFPEATLSPSIGIRKYNTEDGNNGQFHWHGYLREGTFVEC